MIRQTKFDLTTKEPNSHGGISERFDKAVELYGPGAYGHTLVDR